jgi:lipoprotein-releasing system permease protein
VILTDISSVQSLTQIGDNYFGLYVNVESAHVAKEKTIDVSKALGMDYRVRSWWDLNQNFFTAAELEKIVIFIVILFIVIIASLNISSTIFISVLRKYFDIAILKTLGTTESFLIRLFLIQGAFIGLVSILVGILVGVGSALIVKYSNLIYVPGEIYNFDHLPVDIRWIDIVSISVVTFLICLLSSWVPARKGAKQKPTEGLKYESA